MKSKILSWLALFAFVLCTTAYNQAITRIDPCLARGAPETVGAC